MQTSGGLLTDTTVQKKLINSITIHITQTDFYDAILFSSVKFNQRLYNTDGIYIKD